MHFETLESRRLLDGTILFIRGADGSGGFLEGGNLARRNEQLADITDNSTAADNCGWGQLAAQLVTDGFQVEQLIEGAGTTDGNGFASGAPIAFDTLDLSQYAAIVFGSSEEPSSR